MKANNSKFVENVRIFWCYSECFGKEAFCQLGVVGQPVFDADV
jgi:hypothetical protein